MALRRLLGLLFCAGAVWAKVAIPGQSVTLAADEVCRSGEESNLKTADGPQTVATLVNGVWMPGKGYEDRVEHDSASSVVLKRVNYNDNRFFEFFCGSRAVTVIHLMVRAPCFTSATQEQRATLQCHSFTAGRAAKPVRWEKEGVLVCEADPSTGEIRHGSGFENRVSVSPDWLQTGDVSLTFEEVQHENQGVYVCHAQDEDGRGRLVAVSLTVTSSAPDQTTSTPSPLSSDKVDENKYHTCIAVSVVVGLLLFLGGAVLGAWVQSRRKGRHGPGVDNL